MTSNRGKWEIGGRAHGSRHMKPPSRKPNLGTPLEAIATHKITACRAKSGSKITDVLPKSMLRDIGRVHKFAQAAGLFMEERDLLECARCGLLEDVGCSGVLMTYPTGAPPVDSGLRFRKDKRGRYICPNCGAVTGLGKKGRTTA